MNQLTEKVNLLKMVVFDDSYMTVFIVLIVIQNSSDLMKPFLLYAATIERMLETPR